MLSAETEDHFLASPDRIEQLYRQWRNNSQQQKRQRRFSLGSHHSIRTKVNQQQQQQQLGRDKNGESKQRTEASQQPVVVSSAVPGRCVSEDIGRGLFFYLLAINTVETNERTNDGRPAGTQCCISCR